LRIAPTRFAIVAVEDRYVTGFCAARSGAGLRLVASGVAILREASGEEDVH
jgi:hypothetical protein